MATVYIVYRFYYINNTIYACFTTFYYSKETDHCMIYLEKNQDFAIFFIYSTDRAT